MKFTLWMLGLPLLLTASSASAETLSVKLASANFRARPHEAAELKFSADKFFPVDVVEKKNGWAKVRDFEGDEAWVLERALGNTQSVVVSAEKANIREAANTTSDVLFTVKRGEVFKVESRQGNWLKVVDANGDGGFIRDDMTWGELPAPAEVAEKAEELVKGSSSAKETTLALDKAVEITQKVGQATEVKPPAASELETLSKKATEWASRPENLEVLCRAYLEEVKTHSEKKPTATATPKKAGKPAVQPKSASNQKSPAKPKAQQKKAPKKA